MTADFAATVLDTSLSAHAAGAALLMRERLGNERLATLGTFDELTADLRVRLQYLAEAVALGHPRIYLHHVEWLRGAHVARGVSDEVLRLAHASSTSVLRESLPAPAWASVSPILTSEERALSEPWREPASALEGTHGTEASRLLESVLSGSRAEALKLGLEQAARLGEAEFVERVLVAVQRELGRLWQRGEIHVGEEHLGSRLTEDLLSRLPGRGDRKPIGRRVLVASTSGDLHEIGARMVAHRFEREGWDVCFLGANMPRPDLALSLQELTPDVLALSVTLGLHLRGAARIVSSAHALTPRVAVLVGGPAFGVDPEVWRTIGADAMAGDAVTAERKGRELVRVG